MDRKTKLKKRRYRASGHPQCHCCSHPRKDEIDARLLRGDSPESVARAMPPLRPGSVRRHKLNHLNSVLPARLDHVEVARRGDSLCLELGDIVNQVRELYTEARLTMRKAYEEGREETALRANSQALRCLETYFKTAETTYKMSKEANNKSDVMDLSNVVLTALANFPDAKLAVITALQKAKMDDD